MPRARPAEKAHGCCPPRCRSQHSSRHSTQGAPRRHRIERPLPRLPAAPSQALRACAPSRANHQTIVVKIRGPAVCTTGPASIPARNRAIAAAPLGFLPSPCRLHSLELHHGPPCPGAPPSRRGPMRRPAASSLSVRRPAASSLRLRRPAASSSWPAFLAAVPALPCLAKTPTGCRDDPGHWKTMPGGKAGQTARCIAVPSYPRSVPTPRALIAPANCSVGGGFGK